MTYESHVTMPDEKNQRTLKGFVFKNLYMEYISDLKSTTNH